MDWNKLESSFELEVKNRFLLRLLSVFIRELIRNGYEIFVEITRADDLILYP